MENELTKMKQDVKNIDCISFELVASISTWNQIKYENEVKLQIFEKNYRDIINYKSNPMQKPNLHNQISKY